jgi:hypothetical protein
MEIRHLSMFYGGARFPWGIQDAGHEKILFGA